MLSFGYLKISVLLIDTVVFRIRFQIMVSVISMEEQFPFGRPQPKRNLWFQNLSAHSGRQKLNRKSKAQGQSTCD